MSSDRSRLSRRSPFLLLLVAVSVLLPSCATGKASPGEATVDFTGDLPSAVNAVLGAAHGCGFQLTDARRDEAKGSAILVFLDEWQTPRPESARVTVRFEPARGGISCRIEAHPLAEYGMAPPDVTAGREGSVCKPCSQAQAERTLVRYSRGQSMANSARACRCLGEALGAAAPSGP